MTLWRWPLGNRGINIVRETGQTVLHLSTTRGMTAVSLAILGHPEFDEVNARDWRRCTALHLAAMQGNAEICRAILARGDFREVLAESDLSTAPEFIFTLQHLDHSKVYVLRSAKITKMACITMWGGSEDRGPDGCYHRAR